MEVFIRQKPGIKSESRESFGFDLDNRGHL